MMRFFLCLIVALTLASMADAGCGRSAARVDLFHRLARSAQVQTASVTSAPAVQAATAVSKCSMANRGACK